MEIYFLRHASAGQPKASSAKDEKRPLDKLGTEQSHDLGRALAALDPKLDVILSSPLTRAVQTAEVAAEACGHKEKIVTDNALRPEASYEQFQDLLQRYSDKGAILVVGHNPSMTEFLNKLLFEAAALSAVELKKGALAKVEKDGSQSAVLKWCMTPKVVRAIQQASAKSGRPKTLRK
jgi:phosphohistidine phosphatase